jgi:tetratricopeptide (TPR) repeat protein
MIRSLTDNVTVRCPRCRSLQKIDAWMLLNVDERWDLVERVIDGASNIFTCHNCGHITVPWLPVMLFFPDAPGPFLCSPWDTGVAPETVRQQNAHVDRFVRERLREEWQPSWLAGGTLVMPREELVQHLAAHRTPKEAYAWLVQMATEFWLDHLLSVEMDQDRAVIEEHQELLQPLATTILKDSADACRAKGDDEGAAFLTRYRTLLTRCRVASIDSAFEQAARPLLEPHDPELDRLRLDFNELTTDRELTRADTDKAIALCREIVERATEARPLTWGMFHGYWGNLLRTIQADEEARPHLEIAAASAEVQQLSAELFRVFLREYGETVQATHPEHVERAIEVLEAARNRARHADDAETDAVAALKSIRIYALRRIGNPADNLERALSAGDVALAYWTLERSRDDWATVRQYLANVYFRRIRGDAASNAERAIVLAERVLAELKPGEKPELQAILHNGLGNSFVHRPRTDHRHNLSEALRHYQAALAYYRREQFPDWWARLKFNIGHLYLRLPHGGSVWESEDIETAIACFKEALEVRTRAHAPEDWATTLINLSSAYARRVEGEPQANSAMALRLGRDILKVFTRERHPLRWAQAQNNMAAASLNRRVRYEMFWSELGFDRLPEKRINQGLRHLRRGLLEFSAEGRPAEHVGLQRIIGEVCFVRGRWQEAHDAYDAVLTVGEDLFQEAYTDLTRMQAIEQQSIAFARDAFCLYKLGDPGAALSRLERGKLRLLNDWLTLSGLSSSDDSEQAQAEREEADALRDHIHALSASMNASADGDDATWVELTEELRRARAEWQSLVHRSVPPSRYLKADPAAAAILGFVVTSAGGLCFVVRPGELTATRDDVIELPDFGTRALNSLLHGSPIGLIVRRSAEDQEPPTHGWWLLAKEVDKWPEKIRAMTVTLGSALMTPILQHLRRIGIQRGAEVTILPHGGLGLLPLHAAATVAATETATAKDVAEPCVLDEYTVSFAPSRRMMLSIATRAGVPPRARPYVRTGTRRSAPAAAVSVGERTLFAVIDPTIDLAFADVEGRLIAERFAPERRVTLQGEDADVDRVLAQAHGREYLHFACHGSFNWADSSQSGLNLAGNNRLTLIQIARQLDLRGTRLVVLSACSSGQIEHLDTPEEFLGLQTAFLEAGAAAVICSIWPVSDMSTALLMDRFYERHLGGLPLAEALRDAQLWLRDATAGELAARVRDRRTNAMPHDGALSSIWRRLVAKPAAARPFAEPFFWAPFTLYGR